MASLGNILKRGGGTALTGLPVKFHLLVEQKDKTIEQQEVEALLYPVHEEARLDAIEEARAFCDEQKKPGRLAVESDLRFLAKALRDPEDARKQFVMSDELHLLRRGMVYQSVRWLVGQYDKLLESEYPEIFTQLDFDKTKEAAKGFTEDGQEEPGPSSP